MVRLFKLDQNRCDVVGLNIADHAQSRRAAATRMATFPNAERRNALAMPAREAEPCDARSEDNFARVGQGIECAIGCFHARAIAATMGRADPPFE
jgi:hypothetical protein